MMHLKMKRQPYDSEDPLSLFSAKKDYKDQHCHGRDYLRPLSLSALQPHSSTPTFNLLTELLASLSPA